MGGCRCVFRNCTNSSQTAQGMHFFHFPIKDKTRCEKWAFYSDNMSFMELPDNKLKNKVICEDHFRDRCFMNYKKERLIKTAVPTILKLETGEILAFENLELEDLKLFNNTKLTDTTKPLLLNSKSMQNNIPKDDEFSFTMKYVEIENDFILPDNRDSDSDNNKGNIPKYFPKKKPIILNSLASGSGTTFMNKETDILSFPLHDNPTLNNECNNEIVEHTENIIIIEQTDDIYATDNILEHNVLTIAATNGKNINNKNNKPSIRRYEKRKYENKSVKKSIEDNGGATKVDILTIAADTPKGTNINNKNNESLIGHYKKRKYENKSIKKSIEYHVDANKVEINKQMTNKTNVTEDSETAVESITTDNITTDIKTDIITTDNITTDITTNNITTDIITIDNTTTDNITTEHKKLNVSPVVEMIEKDIHTQMITDYEQQIEAFKKLLTEKTNAIKTLKANNAVKNVINTETIKSSPTALTKNQLFTGIRKYLNPSMVALLRMEMFGNSDREYKTDEKLFAKELYQLKGNVYKFLQDEWRFRLPSKKDVESWLNENESDDGEDL